MADDRNIDPFSVIILVASIVGIILLMATAFAGFWIPAGNRYSCIIDCEYYTGGDLAAQWIVFILLVVQIIVATNDLIPERFINIDKLELIGIILAGATLLFAFIGLGIFGITYGFIGDREWWPETGFYGVAIAGLINTILFFLKFKNK
ncbi:MAG: hypothetical protein ACW986_17050 [Promethearchaeota archaeon]|jgi:hypothetical protein